MVNRWIALLVCFTLAAPGASLAAGPDPDVMRAVIGAKVREAIGERRLFDFARSEGTRSTIGPRLYDQTANSVVLIGTKTGSIGGGGFFSSEGYVVTNWHVVADEPYVGVWLKSNTPSIESVSVANMIVAEVVAVDRVRDLALVRLDSKRPWLKPLALGDLSQVKIGQDVAAIGHPKGYLWSYTEGIVSQIRPGKTWQYEDGFTHRATIIQTQTPIGPGNSGAPLFDMTGKVIGITTTTIPDAQNLNFAIAVNEIQDFLRQHSKLR